MLTAWTTYAELTDEQRERFGPYIKACETFRARCAYNHEQTLRAHRLLKEAGGDTQKALALALKS